MRVRLSLLMFLQLFIWGGWFVSMGTYLVMSLGASGVQTGLAYATQSWGAIAAPLLVGVVADRYARPERVLGALHLSGAVALYVLSRVRTFDAFYAVLLPYMILYMPTLALANNVCFRRLRLPAAEFPAIRLWGTLGWIVAGLLVSFVFAWDSAAAVKEGMLRHSFSMCALASFFAGLLCLTLPKMEREGRTTLDLAASWRMGSGAMRLLRDRNYLVFFIASVLVCIPLAFYYQNTNQFLNELGVSHATGKQTLGQLSELLFMLALPFLLRQLGIKGILLFAILAWTVRYLLFAYGSVREPWMLTLGIALHGACYDFFFVSGQIFTDSKAGASIKNSAQGLITLGTYGLGMLVGFYVAGRLTDHYAILGGGHDWRRIWLSAALLASAIAVLFLLFFRNEAVEAEPVGQAA